MYIQFRESLPKSLSMLYVFEEKRMIDTRGQIFILKYSTQ